MERQHAPVQESQEIVSQGGIEKILIAGVHVLLLLLVLLLDSFGERFQHLAIVVAEVLRVAVRLKPARRND